MKPKYRLLLAVLLTLLAIYSQLAYWQTKNAPEKVQHKSYASAEQDKE